MRLASVFVIAACTFSLSIGSDRVFPQKPSANPSYTLGDGYTQVEDKLIYDRIYKELESFIDSLKADYSYSGVKARLEACGAISIVANDNPARTLSDPVTSVTGAVMHLEEHQKYVLQPRGTSFQSIRIVELTKTEQQLKDNATNFREAMEKLIELQCQEASTVHEIGVLYKQNVEQGLPPDEYQKQDEVARRRRDSLRIQIEHLQRPLYLLPVFISVPVESAFAVVTPKSLDGRNGELNDDGALDFANQAVGTQSNPQDVTIRNVSKVDLMMGKVHLDPQDSNAGTAPFTFDSSDCDTKKVLRATEKCIVSVRFAPTTAASELGARKIVIESNAKGSPHRVALTGTGTRGTGAVPVPKPFSNSASYAVGDLVRYSTSTQATIYRAIENNGGPNNLTPDKNPHAWTFVARTAISSDTIAQPKGTTVPRLVVDRAESGHSVFNLCATPSVPLPKLAGWQREEGLSWALSQSNPVRELWGQVVQGHVTTADAFFNHNAIDYNFFVYPDPNFRGLLANPGNFDTGDEFEKGRLEVEWELATPMWKGGLPDWAWPAQGDRVYVVGNFIRDCGHGEFSGGYRTEIHPPQLLVTYRNAALADFANASGRLGSSYNGQWATRVDVFVSNYGGRALASEGIGTSPWQPIGGKEYRFVVRAPPRPSAQAALKMFPQPHEKRSPASYDWLDCQPTVDTYDCTIRVPADASTERDAYLGETIYVYWDDSADAKPDDRKGVPAMPDVRSYALTVTEVEVLHAGGGKWGLYGYVNERAASLLFGDGQAVFGERYAEVKETDRNAKVPVPSLKVFANPTFNVSVIEGQPLHVQFRVIIYDTLLGNNNMGGIAEAYYRREDEKTWSNGELSTRGYGTMNVGSEQSELDPACNDAGCFIVRYKIEKLP